MTKEIKHGVVLIVIGICIPLMVLPFVTGYEKQKGVMGNVYETGIPLRKAVGGGREGSAKPGKEATGDRGSLMDRLTPQMLPFRYILALGVFLVFMGILRIDKARNRPERREGE